MNVQDAEPFPDSLVKQLPATAKRPALDYVSWYQYAARLLINYPDYEYAVTDVTFGNGLWAVSVSLQLEPDGPTKAATGDDTTPSAAESTAFKRACAKFGIGLHLYFKSDERYWLHERLEAQYQTEPEIVEAQLEKDTL